jgi:hypothetical protein
MAVPIVEHGDEVGDVVVLFAVEGVRNGEAEVVVLHVADDLVHLLQRLRHLLLPRVGIGHDVRDVALVRIGGVHGRVVSKST